MKTRPSSDFKLIYDAAKDGNEVALKSLLTGTISVDVRDQVGLFTPAAKLAAKGKTDCVDLLVKLGANTDYIAMGYASAGHLDQAEKIRKCDGVNIKYLAIGAAMHADHAYAEKLRLKYELNPSWFMFGAAYAGHLDYCTELQNGSTQYTSTVQNKILAAKIKGLMMGGNVEAAIHVLESDNSENDYLLKVAIKAAARAANDVALKKLIYRKGSDPYILDYYFELAAIGAAKGGHISYARELLNQTNERARKTPGVSSWPREEQITAVIKAGLLYGHFNLILKEFSDLTTIDKSLLHSQNATLGAFVKKYDELSEMAARHGNLKQCEKLYGESPYTAMSKVVTAMDLGGHFHNHTLLIYALAFVKNQAFLESLTTAAVKLGSDPKGLTTLRAQTQGWTSAFEYQCFADFRRCKNIASKINFLMTKYHFNFDQAEAFLNHKQLRLVLQSVAFKDMQIMRLFAPSISKLCGISEDDFMDMGEKYMLHMLKNMVDKELNGYLERNYYAYNQHYNRVGSLRKACAETKSCDEIKSEIKFEHSLFKGDIIPSKYMYAPKHKQPLKNAIDTGDDCYKTVERLSNHPRFK